MDDEWKNAVLIQSNDFFIKQALKYPDYDSDQEDQKKKLPFPKIAQLTKLKDITFQCSAHSILDDKHKYVVFSKMMKYMIEMLGSQDLMVLQKLKISMRGFDFQNAATLRKSQKKFQLLRDNIKKCEKLKHLTIFTSHFINASFNIFTTLCVFMFERPSTKLQKVVLVFRTWKFLFLPPSYLNINEYFGQKIHEYENIGDSRNFKSLTFQISNWYSEIHYARKFLQLSINRPMIKDFLGLKGKAEDAVQKIQFEGSDDEKNKIVVLENYKGQATRNYKENNMMDDRIKLFHVSIKLFLDAFLNLSEDMTYMQIDMRGWNPLLRTKQLKQNLDRQILARNGNRKESQIMNSISRLKSSLNTKPMKQQNQTTQVTLHFRM